MKKIILTFIGCFIALAAYSQVPYVQFQTVPQPTPNIGGSTNQPQLREPQFQTPPPQQYQVTGGYYYDNYSKSYKRIKIKVNATNSYGQTQVYVRGIYNSQTNMWFDCNTIASKVTSYNDSEEVANNFEWKTRSQLGTIYFNY
jgi:hypothetical protein